MQPSRIAALQAMPIFGGVRAEVLAGLVKSVAVVAIAQDGYFFREGDKAESMFVLETGKVALLKHWEGKPHVLAYLGAGDCFGEMALLDLFPRSASVHAIEPCTAIELSTRSLYQLSETHIDQFALVQMNIARELSRRLRVADEKLFLASVSADEVKAAWAYALG
jgi:CRP-like cAMP-binding protein